MVLYESVFSRTERLKLYYNSAKSGEFCKGGVLMYAIIETGGKQYRVQEGDIINVEKLGIEAGSNVKFDKVLAVSNDEKFTFGSPYVENAAVDASVIAEGKDKKVIIYKYKSKKGFHKKKGHRQPFTQVKIDKINF